MLATADGAQDAIDWLVGCARLSPDDAATIRRTAAQWRADPADMALASGMARADDIALAHARVHGLSVLDPRGAPLDAHLIEKNDMQRFIRARFVPWRRDAKLLIAAVNPAAARPAISEWLGANADYDIAVTTEPVLMAALKEARGEDIIDEAVNGLARRTPNMSARLFAWRQTGVLLLLAVLGGLAFWHWPGLSYLVANLAAGAFFFASMAFRFALLIISLFPRRKPATRTHDATALPDYTLLVALRDEAALAGQLVGALSALDYPTTKLQVLLLVEETDARTASALRALALDGRFQILTVPDRHPRTKPKACNFGLAFARGDFIAVYDAEDRPDTKQLLKALDAFAARPSLSCVQARLTFFNTTENWLTEQFSREFAEWFGFILPAIARLRLPMPLGGTSNHFRREALEAIGGWDAYNVTEDADVGIRLARSGMEVSVLDSETAEEANCEAMNWLHQRSRWLKGYLQTWLVHMRSPARLGKELGFAGFWSFQFLIGGAFLSALLHLVFWATLIAELAGKPLFNTPLPGLIRSWSIFVLAFGYVSAVVSGVVAAFHPQFNGKPRERLILAALTVPIYWFMISFAAVKALFSLVGRPFYWAKTRHGISRLDEQ